MKRLYIPLLILLATTAHAEIYKWKDASGNWQYSDQPPRGIDKGKAKVINTKDQPVSAMPVARSATGTMPAASTASAVAEEGAKRQPNAQACDDARKRLNFLQNATQMRAINEKGQTEFLPADKKKQELAAAQKRIEENCGE